MRKGQKHTEETKRKMHESWKTRPPPSEETRRKIGLSSKGRMAGQKHWNYGNKTPDEVKNKISESLKGEKHPMYGKHHSEETRRRMRVTAKKRPPRSEEHKRKISEKLKGKTHSENTKRKMAEIARNRSPETLRRMSVAQQNRPPISEETRRKQSESHKGIYPSLKTRQKMGDARRGEKNARWLGGKSFEPYGLEFNEKLKQSIRERDNYTCQYMGEPAKDCHHIDYDKTHNTPDNLINLCRKCHTMANSNRIYWKRLFTDMIRNDLKFN